MVDEKSMPKTEEEWKKALTPEQYNVLRMKGTEAPGSGHYLHEKRKGLRQPAVFFRYQVRLRDGLAKLRSSPAWRGQVRRGQRSWYGPDRSRLCPVRVAPRPR